jgi:hypothetical protein
MLIATMPPMASLTAVHNWLAETLRPTPRLHEMKATFERFHDELRVPRQRFRSRLHGIGLHNEQAALARQLFDEFFDCDLLLGYGSGCVKMSLLLAAAARLKGHSARVLPCRMALDALRGGGGFDLGKANPNCPPRADRRASGLRDR